MTGLRRVVEREVGVVPDRGVWWMRTGIEGQLPGVLVAGVAASEGAVVLVEVGAGGAVNGRVVTDRVGAGRDPRERSVGLGRQEASGGHTFGCVLNIGVLFPNVLV